MLFSSSVICVCGGGFVAMESAMNFHAVLPQYAAPLVLLGIEIHAFEIRRVIPRRFGLFAAFWEGVAGRRFDRRLLSLSKSRWSTFF
jgi:hypothetical protein